MNSQTRTTWHRVRVVSNAVCAGLLVLGLAVVLFALATSR